MDGQGTPGHRAGRGRIRAFRVEEVAQRADARVQALDCFASRAAVESRALRAERRNKGSNGYDLLRHIGLMRRRKRQPLASGPPVAQG